MVRKHLSGEAALRCCALGVGGGIAFVAVRRKICHGRSGIGRGRCWVDPVLDAVECWRIAFRSRWVAARSLAAYHAASAGGLVLGSRVWGHLAQVASVEAALLVATALMVASPPVGLGLRMPPVKAREEEGSLLEDPEAGTHKRAPRKCGDRNRISDSAEKLARVSEKYARPPAHPEAQRRLRLVACAKHDRSGHVDRALSRSHLERLSTPTQPFQSNRANAGRPYHKTVP